MSALIGVIDLRYFGSLVRKDSDSASDADVLCVVEDKNSADLSGIRLHLDETAIGGRELDVSVYGKDRMLEMYREGHLFAWHLYKESVPVSDKYGFISSLGKPSKYKRASLDILSLVEVLNDIKKSLSEEGESLVYEAGLLYVVARNIGISASWHSDNGLDFSRSAPFSLSLNGKDLPLDLPGYRYDILCTSRHASVRGSAQPDVVKADLIESCKAIEYWSTSVIKELEVIL